MNSVRIIEFSVSDGQTTNNPTSRTTVYVLTLNDPRPPPENPEEENFRTIMAVVVSTIVLALLTASILCIGIAGVRYLKRKRSAPNAQRPRVDRSYRYVYDRNPAYATHTF